jgi:hypothetical protein
MYVLGMLIIFYLWGGEILFGTSDTSGPIVPAPTDDDK